MLNTKDNAQFYYEKGLKTFKENNFNEAKTFLLKAIKKNPNYFQATNCLCLTYFKLKDYKSAKECFEKIVSMNPNDFEAVYNLALTMQMQKSYEEAKKLYEMALKLNNKDFDSYYNLGVIGIDEKNFTVAQEHFKKALSIEPNKTPAQFYLTKCKDELCKYNNKKEEEEIINSYLKLSVKADIPEEYYITIATAYAKDGEIDKALEFCKKSIENYPDEASAYRLLGLIYIINNDLNNANANLSIAIELDANNEEGYNLIRYAKNLSVLN